jgi:hypothetical protein
MESFYFLFEPPPDCIRGFTLNGGFTFGFIVLFFSSLITSGFFYLALGRMAGKHATYGKWFLFMFLNMVIVFILTTILLSNSVFQIVGGITAVKDCIWFFALLNGTLYAIVFYFIFSLILNNLSKYSRYIPFNLLKR